MNSELTLKKHNPFGWMLKLLRCFLEDFYQNDLSVFLVLLLNGIIDAAASKALLLRLDVLLSYIKFSKQSLESIKDLLSSINNMIGTVSSMTKSPQPIWVILIQQAIDLTFDATKPALDQYATQIRKYTNKFFEIMNSEAIQWMKDTVNCLYTTPEIPTSFDFIDTIKGWVYKYIFPLINEKERKLALDRYEHYKLTKPNFIDILIDAVDITIEAIEEIELLTEYTKHRIESYLNE